MEQLVNKHYLEELLSYLDTNMLKFTKSIGVNYMKVYNIVNGTKTVSQSLVDSIISKYNFVSPSWLLTGEGDMLEYDLKGNDMDLQESVYKTSKNVLKKIKTYYDLSSYGSLGTLIGVPTHKIYKISAGLIPIDGAVAEKIVVWRPELNKDWLLTGNGNMFLKRKEQKGIEKKQEIIEKEQEIIEKEQEEVENINPSGIPLIPFDAIANFGLFDDSTAQFKECEQYIVPEFTSCGAEFVIRIHDNSMYPRYSVGDILACKKINDVSFFQWGKTFVINCSQGVFVRSISGLEDKNCVLLVSENNQKYPPLKISKSDIRSLNLVVGAIKIE